MALSQSRSQNIRAAAILTNAAVNSSPFSVPASSLVQRVMLRVTFTLGSLTNVLLVPQVSYDGTTFYDLVTVGAPATLAPAPANPAQISLTATKSIAVACDVAGAKQFRVAATGTGTVTSSSLQLDVDYQIAQLG